MIKKIVFLTLLGSSYLYSASNTTPLGPNIGYGDSSNTNTVYYTLTNPAYNAFEENPNVERRDFGFGLNMQVGAELNGLKGMSTYFDDKIVKISKDITPANVVGRITQLQNNLTNFFETYDGGALDVIASVNAPLIINNDVLGGGLTFDYNRQIASNIMILDGPNDVQASQDDKRLTINKGTGAIGFTYRDLTEVSFGYGRSVYKKKDKRLTVGVSVRSLNLFANQQNIDFQKILKNKKIKLDDDIKKGKVETQTTFDVGLNATGSNYAVGLLLANLNEPVFKIKNLTDKQYTEFYAKVEKEFKLKKQARLAMKVFSKSQKWTLGLSADLIKTNDLMNNEVQWASANISYASDAWYMPEIRFGVRNNLAGNKFSYKTLGLTIGFLNIDVATTEIDFSSKLKNQEDMGAMVAIAIEFDF